MHIPPLLQSGDTVVIVAPAYAPEYEALQQGMAHLQNLGYEVVLMAHPDETHHRFSASDALRKNYLQSALNHPHAKAIVAARGGYGTTRFIDELDFTSFAQQPKWIVGYSDITALLLKTYACNITSIHGPMAVEWIHGQNLQNLLQALIYGQIDHVFDGYCLHAASFPIRGRLLGGNLTVLAHCVGSLPHLAADDFILLIEDVGEYLYQIDRIWIQLKRAGWLRNLKAVVLGHFTDIKDTEPGFGVELAQIFDTEGVPVLVGFPTGHAQPNLPWFYGAPATIWQQESQFLLSQNVASQLKNTE